MMVMLKMIPIKPNIALPIALFLHAFPGLRECITDVGPAVSATSATVAAPFIFQFYKRSSKKFSLVATHSVFFCSGFKVNMHATRMIYRTRLRSYDKTCTTAKKRIARWGSRRWSARWRNDVDSISQEEPVAPIFRHVSSTGYMTAFNAPLLLNYFIESGNFIHPVTRVPFGTCELLRLQHICGSNIILASIRSELELKRRNMLEREEMLYYLENCISGQIARMVSLAEYSSNNDPQAVVPWYLVNGFPRAHAHTDQLAQMDVLCAQRALETMVEYCRQSVETHRYNPALCAMITAFLNRNIRTLRDWEV